MSKDKHTPTFLPCPFCGSSDFIFLDHYSPDKTVTWFKIMHGAESECSITMIASSKSNLLSQWNGRSYPSELASIRAEKAELIEALRGITQIKAARMSTGRALHEAMSIAYKTLAKLETK